MVQLREGEYELWDTANPNVMVGKVFVEKLNGKVFVEHYALDPNFFPITAASGKQFKLSAPAQTIQSYANLKAFAATKNPSWSYTVAFVSEVGTTWPSA